VTGDGPSRRGEGWQASRQHIDLETGAALRLARTADGGLRFEIDGDDVAVRKSLKANGDFEMTLRASGDEFAVTRRGASIRVSRGERALEFGLGDLDEDGMVRLQQIVSGSAAIRRFRGLHGALTGDTRCSSLGAAADIIDMWVGVLQGQPTPSRPVAATPQAVAMMADDGSGGGGPSCYELWSAEVLVAWNDYTGCRHSFPWYNPLREACSFLWIIRIESAWFQLISCSAIPIKVEACHAVVEALAD
jgi:hypothetical protein